MTTGVVIAGLMAPAGARAADPPQTYVLPVCSTAHGPHHLAGWFPAPLHPHGIFENCTRGGSFGVHASPGGEFGYWVWEAPADVRVAGVRIWRRGQFTADGGYYLAAYWGDAPDSVTLDDKNGVPSGAPQLAEFTGFEADELGIWAFCTEPGCADNPAVNTIEIPRAEIMLRDALPPSAVGELAGTGTQGGALSGDVSLRSAYSDRGGGLRHAALLVDGTEVRRVSIGCKEPYGSAVPCPRSGTTEVMLDTRTVADGPHKLQLALIDVAGNRTLTAPADVEIRNGPLPTPTTPLSFADLRPGTLAVARKSVRGRHNRSVAVTATVRDAARAPIAGAPVTVEVRTAVRGSKYVAAPSVNSDDKGRVTLRLPPGPSRFVRLSYGASTATVAVRVRAPLRLNVTPKSARNGGVIRLTGSVAGTKVRHRVELQAFSGGHWFPFRTVRLRDGKFSARYRFTRTFRTTRYRFRAVVRADADFPYAAGTSPVVAVRVRP